MLNSEENRNKIIQWFPSLKNDDIFKIIDGENPNYNCIAYAANVTDCWWWPLPVDKRPSFLGGVKCNWPRAAKNATSLNVLIEIFRDLNYVECNNYDFEDGFKKVAFYVKGDKFTHAARQLTYGDKQGKWSSKLGNSFLITHKTPQSIEGNAYGKSVFYMKKSMK